MQGSRAGVKAPRVRAVRGPLKVLWNFKCFLQALPMLLFEAVKPLNPEPPKKPLTPKNPKTPELQKGRGAFSPVLEMR